MAFRLRRFFPDINKQVARMFSSLPHEQQRLRDRVAIVTGGSSGIGAATVKMFASHGAKVIIADIQDAPGQDLANEVVYTHCDVSQEAQVSAAVDLALSKYGRLDIMFNNAGIILGSKRPTASISTLEMDELEDILNVNFKGVVHGVKHAARVMIPQKSGSIISTSSMAHICGGIALHPYTVSKHALVGISKSAACELAFHGVRVNTISPAGVLTNIVSTRYWTPADAIFKMFDSGSDDLRKPFFSPDEIAKAALFLACDDSKFVSGHDLVVDGSFTCGGSVNMFKAIQQGKMSII